MSRPKSYNDDDIIKIAAKLCEKGIKPTGWRIKETLGRVKISSIQLDLERLNADGKIPEVLEKEISKIDELTSSISYELPVELQSLLNLREQELCNVLRDITLSIHHSSQKHYETLMLARTRELDIQCEAALKAKEVAEKNSLDIEERLRQQVMKGELIEEQLDEIRDELAELKQEKSELVKSNSKLTDFLSSSAQHTEI